MFRAKGLVFFGRRAVSLVDKNLSYYNCVDHAPNCVNKDHKMEATKSQLLTRVELAKHFDISIDRVQQYVSLGLPVAVKGKQGKAALYDLADCEQWVTENFRQEETGTLQDAKLRKLTAEAALAEIELERERGRLVEIDEVAKQVTAMLSNVRAKLLALPTKMSGIVLGLQRQAEIKEVLDDAVREVLEELANADTVTNAREQAQ